MPREPCARRLPVSRRLAAIALALGVVVTAQAARRPRPRRAPSPRASSTSCSSCSTPPTRCPPPRSSPRRPRSAPSAAEKTVAGYVIGSTGAHRAQVPLIVYPPSQSSLTGLLGLLDDRVGQRRLPHRRLPGARDPVSPAPRPCPGRLRRGRHRLRGALRREGPRRALWRLPRPRPPRGCGADQRGRVASRSGQQEGLERAGGLADRSLRGVIVPARVERGATTRRRSAPASTTTATAARIASDGSAAARNRVCP